MKSKAVIDAVIRARHHSWPDRCSEDNLFAGSVTIDPSEILSAWETLSQGTRELEAIGYPALIHKALVETLRKRLNGERRGPLVRTG